MARLDDATGSVVVRQRLDPHPSSVSRARRLVTRALGDLGRAELADDAALVVSELVTNALVHAGTSIEVVVSQREAEVVVEVLDDNPRLPFRRHHAELAGTGRGLHLVEQLSADWGAVERPPGKSVWFRLGAQPVVRGERHERDERDVDRAPEGREELTGELTGELSGDLDADLDALLAAFPDEAGAPAEPEPAVLDVILLRVPLLLHAAWQMQAESVLREYLLTRLAGSDDSVEQELGAHAMVHEAIVLLQENLPAPDLGDHPEQLLSAAVEPLVSAERLVFPVPTSALRNFELLEEALDDAMELAEAGGLLTPPTQPEVREFRRWLCRQVRVQRAGGTPEPWRSDLDTEMAPSAPEPAWDTDVVTSAEIALIAAADTNRIVAVSEPASRMLGYGSPAELVGRRLLDIIPPRYRQAHLAGFTLHLFAGRAPLLGHWVSVPALRRDGTEVVVQVLIEAVSLTGGRHVFLAQLTPSESTQEGLAADAAD